MSSSRPHLECPLCGECDIVPLVAIRNFGLTWPRLGLALGYPEDFPFLGPSYSRDLQWQGYVKKFVWDQDRERPTWWCKRCEQPIVSFGSNNEELLAQAWSYIESAYIPTPYKHTIEGRNRLRSRRMLAFLKFLAEVIPQALLEHATAIRLNECAFLIKGEWVAMAEFKDLDDLLGAVRDGHLPGTIKLAEGQSTTVSVHQVEYYVTLRPNSLDQGRIELELLDHNYPGEFFQEITPRERKA